MQLQAKANKEFKCSCRVSIGYCQNLEHPRLFMEYPAFNLQNYIERWSLSKYAIWENEKSAINPAAHDTKLGSLIYDYKYRNYSIQQPLKSLDPKEKKILQDRSIEQIYKYLKYFLNNYFPDYLREFNSVVPIPSASDSSRNIPQDLSEKLFEIGLVNYDKLIKKTEIYVGKTSNLPLPERKVALQKKFVKGDSRDIDLINGVLVIDDVYEYGATAKRILDILNEVIPNVPKYFLSVTFTRLDIIRTRGKP